MAQRTTDGLHALLSSAYGRQTPGSGDSEQIVIVPTGFIAMFVDLLRKVMKFKASFVLY